MNEQAIFAWIGTDGDRTIEYMLYGGIAIVLLIVTTVLYLIWRILEKYVLRRKFSGVKSILVIAVVVLAVFFSVYILPDIVRRVNWQSLMATCAEQVGYGSPDDNNNLQIATSESQMRYQECITVDN